MAVYMIYGQHGLPDKTLVLGTHAAAPDTVVQCAGEPGKSLLVWSLREIPGSHHVFLKQEDTNLYAKFAERNGVVTLAKLDPQDKMFALQLAEVADGYVSIRNHEGSLAMGPRNGARDDGVRIVGTPYAGSPHQNWLIGPPSA